MILTNTGVLKLMQRIKSFITSQLNTKANSVHTHSISEIDDLSTLQMGGGVYSKSEVDTLLTGKADTSHTHTKSDITDFPTIPTKTSDLTNDLGFISSEIDSSGTGWVRFKSGLQICYGIVTNNNNIATGVARHSFPMAFIATPNVVALPKAWAESNIYTITKVDESGTTFIINSWANYAIPPVLSDSPLQCDYMAIGKWK